MNSKALLAATAAILALSAVSCGKEDGESSVSVAYNESTKAVTTAETTEESGEEETTEKAVSGTKTTTATTEVSGTETTASTTVSGEETSSETTTSSAADSAETTTTTETSKTVYYGLKRPATETTAPAATETPTEDNTPAPDDDSNDNNDDDNNNNNDTPTEEPQTTEEPTTEPPTENNTLDFKFTVDNLLNDASGLLSMLGTPDYSGVAEGCTTNGNDVKIYQFDGLELQCYIDGATEYIFSIEITGDQYETDKGIKTGASRSEVEAAYGTGETSGNMTVYYSGNNEMDIEYSGDTVTSIFFYAPV